MKIIFIILIKSLIYLKVLIFQIPVKIKKKKKIIQLVIFFLIEIKILIVEKIIEELLL